MASIIRTYETARCLSVTPCPVFEDLTIGSIACSECRRFGSLMKNNRMMCSIPKTLTEEDQILVDRLEAYQKKTDKEWREIADEVGISYRGLRYVRTGQRKAGKAVKKLINLLEV